MEETPFNSVNTRRTLGFAFWLAGCLAASHVVAAPPTIQPGSWTLAILPDTPYYTAYNNGVFEAQTQFLANQKSALNLKYVLHEGDVTQSNTAARWIIASNAMQTLDNAGIPYSLAVGNHDLDGNVLTRDTLISTYFPTTRLDNQPTYGGVVSGGPYGDESTITSNSYSLFSAGSIDWLVISMEYGPRDGVVDWADALMKQYPNRRTIIVTHAYLYPDGTRVDWATYGASQDGNPHDNDGDGIPDNQGFTLLPGGVNDGGELGNALTDNPNLSLVFNGHFTTPGSVRWTDPGAAAYLASAADDGHIVHQMLANYQWVSSDNGYLRLLEFQPNGQVHVRTYSPNKNLYLSDAANAFVFSNPPATRIPGDATGDNKVDEEDAQAVTSHWGSHNAMWHMGDFNADGVVGPADAAILTANWGYGVPGEAASVPEPPMAVASIAALLAAAAARGGHRNGRRPPSINPRP